MQHALRSLKVAGRSTSVRCGLIIESGRDVVTLALGYSTCNFYMQRLAWCRQRARCIVRKTVGCKFDLLCRGAGTPCRRLRHLIESTLEVAIRNASMPGLTDTPLQTGTVKVSTPRGCHKTDRIRAWSLSS